MECHAITWESVAVMRGEQQFELTVRLNGDPSSDWEVLFNQAAEQDGLQERGWALVRLSNGTISMRELRPDAREQARRHLNEIVSKTNGSLAAKREAEEQERIRAEQEETELRRTAQELTDWFRKGTGASPETDGSARTRSEPEEGEANEQADLRDRLVHVFRSDAA
jgi:hypothetical protein